MFTKRDGGVAAAFAGAILSGCTMTAPRSADSVRDSVTVAYMDSSGALSREGEHVSRVSTEHCTDFIVDDENRVWKRAPELSNCRGGFAVPSLQAFGTYYVPAPQAESELVLRLMTSK